MLGNFYLKNTEVIPSSGGSFTEGVVGRPRFINPIYANLSDVDRDLTQLVFAGLMNYNNNGDIIPELIEKYRKQEQEYAPKS